MVVYTVTLQPRVTMLRPTAYAPLKQLLRTASAAALLLAGALSCSSDTAPSREVYVQVPSVILDVPDSVKDRLSAEAAAASASIVPLGASANIVTAPSTANASVDACNGGGSSSGYTKARVAFDPEPIPNIIPYPLGDEGFIPDSAVLLGFNFNYQGNTYDRVNVYFNGFLLFGPVPDPKKGYSDAMSLPSTLNPRNIIALAWSDWDPGVAPGSIRFETRGSAPHRRFVIQYNNVPEFNSANRVGNISLAAGNLMSQVVLSEGTNDITIYTNKMFTTSSRHFITQAIENAAGTEAVYDSVVNAAGVLSTRNRNFYSLTNDALRFSPIQVRDEIAPTFDAPPAALQANNDPTLASAMVAVATPTASDNCSNANVTYVRSDGKDLNAPYPVGVTTITWTATDGSENVTTATQTVTVIDVENPTIQQSDFSAPATSPAGAVVKFAPIAGDNVGVVSVECSKPSGSVFPIGSTPVDCTAADAAGNSATVHFDVAVLDAPTQMRNLMQYVIGLALSSGTTNPLVNQLQAALRGDSHVACVKMRDFMKLVGTKGRDIPDPSEAYMNAEATRIMTVLDCSLVDGHAEELGSNGHN